MLRRAFALASGPLVLGSIALLLNHLRFGSPWRFGYRFMIVPPFLRERLLEHGQLSVAYLARNLRYIVLELPMVVRDTPGDVVFPGSPAIRRAWACSSSRPPSSPCSRPCRTRGAATESSFSAAWLSLILTCLPRLLYYNTGWVQWDGRFLVNAWPMWLLLTATGLRRFPPRVALALMVLSVVSNSWAVMLSVFSGLARVLSVEVWPRRRDARFFETFCWAGWFSGRPRRRSGVTLWEQAPASGGRSG